MSANGHVSEVTPEVQAAYDELISSFGAFLQAIETAGNVGIDTRAVLAGSLRDALGEEEFDKLPAPVRMLLG